MDPRKRADALESEPKPLVRIVVRLASEAFRWTDGGEMEAFTAVATARALAEPNPLSTSFTRSIPWWYLFFFFSGFPALLYQTVWQRALFTLYGVNIESVTMVVTAFMLGLGLGGLL